MRFNFKKITAIGASVLLTGLTMGLASAAAYPGSFTASNTAVVYGASAASTDITMAENISSSLGPVTSTSTSVSAPTGGDTLPLALPQSYLDVGSNLTAVFGRSITSSDMPTLLASGTYTDSNSQTYEYNQKIDVAGLSLNQFNLQTYSNTTNVATPAIGIPLKAGSKVANYTLTFQTPVNISSMQYSNLPFMGSSYYVLSASNSSITLLDSASGTKQLASGASATYPIGGTNYDVSATIYSNGNVVFTINGQVTKQLSKGDTVQLTNGAYLGVQSVAAASYAGGPSAVQFSLGSGKIILNNGSSVQINSNSVSGIEPYFTLSGGKLSSIRLVWTAGSGNQAITTDHSLTIPAFGTFKLSFGGMTYPKMENMTLGDAGSSLQLNGFVTPASSSDTGAFSLDILNMNQSDGNYTSVGGGVNNYLRTNTTTTITNVQTSDTIVVSWKSSNGKSAISQIYTVGSINKKDTSHNADYITLNPVNGGQSLTIYGGASGTTGNADGGSVVLSATVNASKTGSEGSQGVATITASGGSGTASFNKLYTADGLEVVLPTSVHANNNASGPTVQSYPLQFVEAASDGTIGGGSSFNISVGGSGSVGSYQPSVSSVAAVTPGALSAPSGASAGVKEGSTSITDYVMASPLATSIVLNKVSAPYTASLTYHGSQSYGTVYLSSANATTSTSSSSTGSVPYVTDSAASSLASGTNLIVVGGTCVNTVAASLLGVPAGTCGASWTSKTGLGSGQFLIESFANNTVTGGAALLVAGTDAADTINAATYLMNQKPDVAAGKEWTGKTATSATLVTTA